MALAAVRARVLSVLHRKHDALVGICDSAALRGRLDAPLLGNPVRKGVTSRPAVLSRTRGARTADGVAIPRVLPRRRAAGAMVRARVYKGAVAGVAQQATLEARHQVGAEAVDEGNIVGLANHVPNLPLVVFGLLGEERSLDYRGEMLGKDAVGAEDGWEG